MWPPDACSFPRVPNIRDPAVLSTYAMVDHYSAKPIELDALLKVLRTS